jgi:hypothetical protein
MLLAAQRLAVDTLVTQLYIRKSKKTDFLTILGIGNVESVAERLD